MSRIRIDLPQQFSFTTNIPIRITDINYGGHGGNDTVLGLIHEARMQFLAYHGYTEMDFEGVGLIMSDAGIEYKNEIYYGDTVIASVAIGGITRVSFDLFYKFEKEVNGKLSLIVKAKTGMVCYDYSRKKVVGFPKVAAEKLS